MDDLQLKIFHTSGQSRRAYSTDLLVIITGAVSGFLAALPMSIGMNLMHRLLPEKEKYPLPPREITLAASERVGIGKLVSVNPTKTIATWIGHYSYGALGGIIYSVLFRRLPVSPLVKGTIFVLLFWAFGYMGWLPAVGLLSPATRHPPRRTVLTITAHLIYGSATVSLLNAFLGKRGPLGVKPGPARR
jgi:uncharacterized membrane protein YagU involved in acid resistance